MSKSLAGILAVFLVTTPALAHEYNAGPLRIGHPWSRATPKGAAVGGGFLTITNTGSAPDRLVGGTTSVAKEFHIHQTTNENGVMRMRAVEGGLEIKPGETVTFKPGSYHVMFVGLDKPLKQGDRIQATLEFAKAGKVQVEFTVEGIGATHDKPAVGAAGHDMPGTAGQHGH